MDTGYNQPVGVCFELKYRGVVYEGEEFTDGSFQFTYRLAGIEYRSFYALGTLTGTNYYQKGLGKWAPCGTPEAAKWAFERMDLRFCTKEVSR